MKHGDDISLMLSTLEKLFSNQVILKSMNKQLPEKFINCEDQQKS